jgi:methyltransferase (TIGR00027 family)
VSDPGQLALTAWWTAAARAHETRRHDRLFDDPWAALLAGPNMVAQFDHVCADMDSVPADIHAVTTRYFDDFLLRVTAACGVRQVVLVAAGLDARAYRLAWPTGTHVFELDQPRIIDYKNCLLGLSQAIPRCTRVTVAADLGAPWTDSLRQGGFDAGRSSVWVLEGFLYFLSESAVRNILTTVADLAARGSYLAAEFVNGAMLTSAATRHWNERMSAAGAPWLFTSERPEALLAEFGWSAKVVESGEAGTDFGRLPRRVAPRATSGEPRSFLATAGPRV